MSKGITFTDKKEALEYVRAKQTEGQRATLYKKGNKYLVYIIGKLAKIDKVSYAGIDWHIPIETKETDTTSDIYNRLVKRKVKPQRNSAEMKAKVNRMLKKEGLDKVEVFVTKRMSLTRIAATNYPENKQQNYQILIHPINKFINPENLEELVNHEIEHIKEHEKEKK